jgi:hypothetical protein
LFGPSSSLVTLNASGSSNQTIRFPNNNPGSTSDVVLTTGTQNIDGAKVFIGTSTQFNSAILVAYSTATANPAIASTANFTNGLDFDSVGAVFTKDGTFQFRTASDRLTTNVPFRLYNGSAALPSLGFVGSAWDSNTGIYWDAEDRIGVSAGGISRMTIGTSSVTATVPIVVPPGAQSDLSMRFSNDTDTGLFREENNGFGIVAGGTVAFIAVPTGLTMYGGLTEAVNVRAQGISMVDGSDAAPSIYFMSDTNSGFFKNADGKMGYTANGSTTVVLGTNGISVTDGASSGPPFYFYNDTDTGLYRQANNTLGFASGGSLAAIVNTTAFKTTNGTVITSEDGSAGSPSYGFTQDAGSGIYRIGTDNWAMSAAGAKVWETTAAGEITKPLQPCFLSYSDTQQTDVTGDGSAPTVAFNAEVFDKGADFNTGTYTFTAPITGKYSLSTLIRCQGIDSTHEYMVITLVTSNANYQTLVPVNSAASITQVIGVSMAAVDMDANDTAYVVAEVGVGNKVVDIYGTGYGANTRTWFSGSLQN